MNRAFSRVWLSVAAGLLLLVSPARSQTAQEPAKPEPVAKAATKESSQVVVPVEALKFAADLKRNTSPEVWKWIGKQATGPARGDDEPIVRLIKETEQSFPKTPPALQDALVFLIFYSQYESDRDLEAQHTNDVKSIDRDVKKLQDELRMWEETFSHPEPGSTAAAQRTVRVAEINQGLEFLSNRRRPAALAQALYKQRVNYALLMIDHGYKALAKLPPAMMARVPAPAPEN